ncbi:hypothetical protein BVRB_2g047420 [Beta vulgaris subsp. vulgaris]|uniref:Uncharacterized protein n=1 Tax=Beta vulgaris subsp. vulgaris TaxID=3555 RepID=A0A0J8BGN8_BETVV|nr:hypothetical protein BVRB_2g047420 [Beta vulgaris subsp. vulgaris]
MRKKALKEFETLTGDDAHAAEVLVNMARQLEPEMPVNMAHQPEPEMPVNMAHQPEPEMHANMLNQPDVFLEPSGGDDADAANQFAQSEVNQLEVPLANKNEGHIPDNVAAANNQVPEPQNLNHGLEIVAQLPQNQNQCGPEVIAHIPDAVENVPAANQGPEPQYLNQNQGGPEVITAISQTTFSCPFRGCTTRVDLVSFPDHLCLGHELPSSSYQEGFLCVLGCVFMVGKGSEKFMYSMEAKEYPTKEGRKCGLTLQGLVRHISKMEDANAGMHGWFSILNIAKFFSQPASPKLPLSVKIWEWTGARGKQEYPKAAADADVGGGGGGGDVDVVVMMLMVVMFRLELVKINRPYRVWRVPESAAYRMYRIHPPVGGGDEVGGRGQATVNMAHQPEPEMPVNMAYQPEPEMPVSIAHQPEPEMHANMLHQPEVDDAVINADVFPEPSGGDVADAAN